jgi:DNA-binding transcriptional MerR regulator
MKTSDILQTIDIPRHKLYYLEQKGYVVPRRVPMGDLEAREYTVQDATKIKLIWKYLRKGFKHKVAYQKALEELALSPDPSLHINGRGLGEEKKNSR